MRERHLGSSGLVVSVVGLGCNNFGWRIDEAQTRAVVDAALDAGITLFDTAESYGDGDSEGFLGRALAGRRDRAVIATKFGWGKGRDDNSVAARRPGLRPRRDRRARCGGSAPTTSTSTSTTAPTASPRSRRRSARWTSSSARARCATSARSNFSAAQVARGRRGRRGARPDAVRLGAERVLAARARGRARADPGLRAARARPAPVLPARARAAHRASTAAASRAPEGTRLAAQGLDVDERDVGRGSRRSRRSRATAA